MGIASLGPSTVKVELRDGGIGGPVIATSPDLTLNGPLFTGTLFRLVFGSPVTLVRGNSYVIELVFVSGVNGTWERSTSNTYSGGIPFVNGTPESINASEVPQTVAIEDEPFDSVISDTIRIV